MTGLVILLGGITLFAGVLTILDGIAYRRRQATLAKAKSETSTKQH